MFVAGLVRTAPLGEGPMAAARKTVRKAKPSKRDRKESVRALVEYAVGHARQGANAINRAFAIDEQLTVDALVDAAKRSFAPPPAPKRR